VPLLSRTLHRHRGRDAVGKGELTFLDERGERLDESGRQLFGVHRPSVSALLGFLSGDIGR
jgi:hypothetical protein